MKKVKRKLSSSLFIKYFFTVALSISLTLIILGGMLFVLIQNYWMKEKKDSLLKNVIEVSDFTEETFRWVNSNEVVSNVISGNLKIVSETLDADIFICDTEGQIIFWGYGPFVGSRPNVINNYGVPSEVMKTAIETQEGYADIIKLGDISRNKKNSAVVAKRLIYHVKSEDYEGDYTYVIVGFQDVSQAVTPAVQAFFKMFGISTIMSLAVAFLVGWLMTYKMTKPLRQMAAATKAYASGDFSPRITVRGEDELSELASAFNSMAKSLAILETSRRSFVANVSHELKTPMTTIGGFIDGILDGTIDESKKSHYLKIVSDEIKRLSRLVVGMLNMSKIEAGELQIKPKVFDLSQMIITTLLGFEHLIENKAVNVLGLEDIETCSVKADGDLINQVVYNLIDNAVKFVPENGYIKIKLLKNDKEVIVAVRNSGNGIPRDERERIFERFYKIDKSRSFDIKGAGLGLYIVKTIVDMHGGKISVDSLEGEYTEFCFRLPNNN